MEVSYSFFAGKLGKIILSNYHTSIVQIHYDSKLLADEAVLKGCRVWLNAKVEFDTPLKLPCVFYNDGVAAIVTKESPIPMKVAHIFGSTYASKAEKIWNSVHFGEIPSSAIPNLGFTEDQKETFEVCKEILKDREVKKLYRLDLEREDKKYMGLLSLDFENSQDCFYAHRRALKLEEVFFHPLK